jgi:hypothetical protein
LSWKPEVHTAGDPDGVFNSNAVRFATKEECDRYLVDLSLRWTAVRDVRSTECDDPVTYKIENDRCVPIHPPIRVTEVTDKES